MPTEVFRPPEPPPLPDAVLSGWAAIPTTIASDVSRGRLLIDPRIRPLRPLHGGPRLSARRSPPGASPATSAPHFMRSLSRAPAT